MFKITSPFIHGDHYQFNVDEENGTATAKLFINETSYTVELSKTETDELFDICEVTDHHILNFSGFDFTPSPEQRAKLRRLVGVNIYEDE